MTTYTSYGFFTISHTEQLNDSTTALFYENEDGQDYYLLANEFPKDECAFLLADESGYICSASSDCTMLSPNKRTLIKSDDIEEANYLWDGHPLTRWKWDGTTIVKPIDGADEIEAFNVRTKRDALLGKQVDPLVTNPLRWADLTAEKQAEWTQYRRDLLDITEQAGFPHNIVWPIKPE